MKLSQPDSTRVVDALASRPAGPYYSRYIQQLVKHQRFVP